MKNKFVLGMIAVAVIQSALPAEAQYRGQGRNKDHGYGRGDGPGRPAPYPGQGQRLESGSVEVSQISRSSGGAWYRVNLRRSLRLERIDISVLNQRLKIHEVSVITDRRERIQLKELTNSPVVGTGSVLSSNYLNVREEIIAIDIRAESYGGVASMLVTALSNQDRPSLELEQRLPEPPSRPVPGPGRPNPGYPDNGYNNCGRNDITNDVNYHIADLEAWISRYNNSYSGTPEKSMAQRYIDETAKRIQDIARSESARTTTINNLEALASRSYSKMSAQYSGTAGYNAWASIATALFSTMATAVDTALDCNVKNTTELLSLAKQMDSKRQSQYSGTISYNGYDRVVSKLFAAASAYYENEVRRFNKDFNIINQELEKYDSARQSLYSGTTAYNGYQTLIQKAASLAQADLRNNLYRLRPNDRYDLLKKFESRRNSFYSGTVVYNHYQAMMNIVSN